MRFVHVVLMMVADKKNLKTINLNHIFKWRTDGGGVSWARSAPLQSFYCKKASM